MAYSGMGGGPDSGHPGGGTSPGNVNGGNQDGGGGMDMSGPASAPDVDPDVEAAISGAISANGGATSVNVQNMSMNMAGPASQVDVQFDPSAAPVGVNTESPQNQPAPTMDMSGPASSPDAYTGLQMESRDFRAKLSGFLDSVKNKPSNQQQREVQAFLDDTNNQESLRSLSIDYANNIDDEMGFGKFVPGVGILSGMRTMTMKGLRAMGLEPGINTPEMDALESLAGRLGISIDSRSGGIAEMPGYRWDEETGTYKKITELNKDPRNGGT